MFEFKVACRYLLPKKRSLSTALISIVSTLVISLVIWLVILFLSITSGIEGNWLKKLTSLHAPIRIVPTEHYYQSYYYQIDRLSAASDYRFKTLEQKLDSPSSDPYDPEMDPEIPAYIPAPERTGNTLLDPTKQLFSILENLQSHYLDFRYQDFEFSSALLRLYTKDAKKEPTCLSQVSYLLSLADKNPHLASLLIPGYKPEIVNEKGHLHLEEKEGITPILLAKYFQEQGVEVGTKGTLGFLAPSLSTPQEQRIFIKVVGFYDPGLLPTGNKCILLPKKTCRSLSVPMPGSFSEEAPTNGIFVWTKHLSEAKDFKNLLQEKLREENISSFWKIEHFEEFSFSKDLLQQFQSDRLLFLLIASIILVVATSNIISLLTLLVNDKKKEIAILRAMGASFFKIAAIFALAGFTIGILSCILGTLLAIWTLAHLDQLVLLLSTLQGHSAFNPAFFGGSLPSELSYSALWFIFLITPLLCILAGLIPAIKATRSSVSSVLRSE